MLSEIRKKKLEKNIWKFYLYRFFASLTFIGPIFVLFYQNNGLSMTEVMILQAVYTAVIMIGVIPAGIAADYIGRKKVLIVNSIFFTAGWAIFALSHGFTGFFIAEATVALSSAMWMASGTAFFYDNLRELDREGSYKRLFGKVVGINNMMWAIGSLAGGYIALHSLRATFWVTVVTVFFSFLVTLSFTETKNYKHGDKRYFKHLKEASRFAVYHPRVRLFIVYSAIFVSVFFTCFILYQPYLKSISIPLVYFGWIYFAMNTLAAVGSRLAHKIEILLGERNILMGLLVIAILCIFGMSKGYIILGAIFPILLFFAIGVFEPVMSDYVNKRTESHHRATVTSLQELVTRLVSSVIAPFFGWMVDFWSISTAFKAATIILIVNLFILIGVFTIIRRKER